MINGDDGVPPKKKLFLVYDCALLFTLSFSLSLFILCSLPGNQLKENDRRKLQKKSTTKRSICWWFEKGTAENEKKKKREREKKQSNADEVRIEK